MQTVLDMNRLGYQVHDRIPLQRGRTSDWEAATLPRDSYVPGGAGVLHDLNGKTLNREEAREAEQAIKSGRIMLLTAADFQSSPPVVTYRMERSGPIVHGGPGGYPHQPEKVVTTGTRSMDDLAREITGHPMATWAIRPQVGSYPDVPELYLFTPARDGGPLSAEDVITMMEGRRVGQDAPEIQVGDQEVLIGSIRLDRKVYLIRFGG